MGIRNIRIGFLLGVLPAVVVALMGVSAAIALRGLRAMATQSENTCKENILAKAQLAAVTNDYAEIRRRILLALRHAPDSHFLSMPDHPVSLHIDNIDARLKSGEEVWRRASARQNHLTLSSNLLRWPGWRIPCPAGSGGQNNPGSAT